jgi:cytochrome c biogenesis protein CcmG, thiol:disulfide interchange protein DsbE
MNIRKSLIGIGVAAAIIALLGYGLTLNPREIPSPLPGTEAPLFTLPSMDEVDTIDLAALRGDVVVLNFWASWCVPCRIEHADLVQAASMFQPRGVHFFGILYQDRVSSARAFIEELGGINYPSLLDEATRTGIAYGITGVPETFVIGRDGKVVWKYNGPVTAGLLASVIEPLLGATTDAPASALHGGGT